MEAAHQASVSIRREEGQKRNQHFLSIFGYRILYSVQRTQGCTDVPVLTLWKEKEVNNQLVIKAIPLSPLIAYCVPGYMLSPAILSPGIPKPRPSRLSTCESSECQLQPTVQNSSLPSVSGQPGASPALPGHLSPVQGEGIILS